MCYYTANKLSGKDIFQLEHDFVVNWEEEDREDYFVNSGFSHKKVPVITSDGKFTNYRWGLIPSWTKDFDDAKKRRIQCLNSVSETIETLPSFRNSVKEGKFCIIPVNGFYEWHHGAKEKYPHFIYPKNASMFYFAGIFERWTNKAIGEIHDTFSVCTTPANERMEWIHNSKKRMPAILHLNEAKLWIDRTVAFEQKKKMLVPYPSSEMLDHPVSRLITSRKENTNVEAVMLPFQYPDLDA